MASRALSHQGVDYESYLILPVCLSPWILVKVFISVAVTTVTDDGIIITVLLTFVILIRIWAFLQEFKEYGK